MRTIDQQELSAWLAMYGHTQRHCWLHPDQLAHQSEYGGTIRPILDTVWNDDSEDVQKAKYEYYNSNYYFSLTAVEKREKADILGWNAELKAKLSKRPSVQKVLE